MRGLPDYIIYDRAVHAALQRVVCRDRNPPAREPWGLRRITLTPLGKNTVYSYEIGACQKKKKKKRRKWNFV
jgi:hypothetical protein